MNGFKALENEDPEMFSRITDRYYTEEDFKNCNLKIDAREVFDLIRDIKDPEHPMTLEELGVVELDMVQVDDEMDFCYVRFKPTIPHCSMATLIGLAVKVQLLRLLPARFKVDVCIEAGTHVSCTAINKQLADKERIAAALENVSLHEVINDCILYPESQTLPNFLQDELKKANKLQDSKVKYILKSRHHVECYRRWNDIVYGDPKKWKSSLSFNVDEPQL